MNALESIRYEETSLSGKTVAFVTLNRPSHGNRIDVQMIKDLSAVCDHL